MRLTTRLAIGFLAATILALTIYAYPTGGGLLTLLFRAAAILGLLAITVLIAATAMKRRPGGVGLIIFLTALGLIATAWGQLAATADFKSLSAEIEDAGEENVAGIIDATDTDSGALVRAGIDLRQRTNAAVEVLFPALWDAGLPSIFAGADADNDAARAAASERIATLLGTVETQREAARALLDGEIEEIDAVETPLPDKARISFGNALFRLVEDDRAFFEARFDLAVARLEAAASAIATLDQNVGGFAVSAATNTVVFEVGGALLTDAATRYQRALEAVDAAPVEEANLIVAREAASVDEIMALVEAVGTPP